MIREYREIYAEVELVTTYDDSTHIVGGMNFDEKVTPIGRSLVEITQDHRDSELAAAKTAAKQRITDGFFVAQATGKLMLSFGWEIDCRRSDRHNDVQNMDSLYDLMTATGQQTIDIRGADNISRVVTLAELAQIRFEMKAYGAGLYQHKWAKDAEIDAATTAQDVLNVAW